MSMRCHPLRTQPNKTSPSRGNLGHTTSRQSGSAASAAMVDKRHLILVSGDKVRRAASLWAMTWIIVFSYLAGLGTVPIFVMGTAAITWAFGKSTGTGACVTHCRGSRNRETGEHLNITVWAESTWHRLAYSSRASHKAAVIQYWQGIYDAGGQWRENGAT